MSPGFRNRILRCAFGSDAVRSSNVAPVFDEALSRAYSANYSTYPIEELKNLSEEEADNLATRVLPPSLLVVHNAVRGRQHEVTELTRGQNIRGKLFDFAQ